MKTVVAVQATSVTSVNVEHVSGNIKITHLVGGLFAEKGYIFFNLTKESSVASFSLSTRQ